jgi:hypothetical protein
MNDAMERLTRLTEDLRPAAARARVLAALDGLFRGGNTPYPSPDGFLRGRIVTTAIWGPYDRAVLRVASLWMPWLGKTFDAPASAGVNRFAASARIPVHVLFPSHEPKPAPEAGRFHAFPFRTAVGPGELDRAVRVLKIDYDFDANPSFIIRSILDEVVQIDEGLYLGKILFRRGRSYHRIGFFSLERGD